MTTIRYDGQLAVLKNTKEGPLIQVIILSTTLPLPLSLLQHVIFFSKQHPAPLSSPSPLSHLSRSDTQHMAEQEREHQATFNELIRHFRVRPTALTPFWNVAGFALGMSPIHSSPLPLLSLTPLRSPTLLAHACIQEPFQPCSASQQRWR